MDRGARNASEDALSATSFALSTVCCGSWTAGFTRCDTSVSQHLSQLGETLRQGECPGNIGYLRLPGLRRALHRMLRV